MTPISSTLLSVGLIALSSLSSAQEGYHLRAETSYSRPADSKTPTLKQNSEVIIKDDSSWVNVPAETTGATSQSEKPLQILTRVSKANRETADVEYIVMRPTPSELPVVSTGRVIVRWNEPAMLHEVTADKDFSFKVVLKKTQLTADQAK